MRNKSTFAGVLVGLLVMACCGMAQAGTVVYGDWFPINDTQKNGLDLCFGRIPGDLVVYVRVRNRYNVGVAGEIYVDVVNNLDGAVNAARLIYFRIKPNGVDADGGNYLPINGNLKTTSVSLKNIRIKTLSMALASDPTGQSYEVYPDNQLAKHEQKQRDDAAAKQKQQADDARQKQEDAQKQQQQEQQQKIDAEKQRVHDVQKQQANQAVQNAKRAQQQANGSGQTTQQIIQNNADSDAAYKQAISNLPKDRDDNLEIQALISKQHSLLLDAAKDDRSAKSSENFVGMSGGPNTIAGAYAQEQADKFHQKAQDERNQASDMDRQIADAREHLRNGGTNDNQDNGKNSESNTNGSGAANQITSNPYLKAANSGDVNEMYLAAGNYYAKQDYVQAAQWYQKAADNGNGNAFWNLASIYYYGMGGFRQDYVQAMELYKKAASTDTNKRVRAGAMTYIGIMYSNGNGAPRDYVQAAQWFQKGADMEDIDAMYYLGDLYNNGLGTLQDYTQAMHWYMKASNDISANVDLVLGWLPYKIGLLYEKGQGVGQDYAQAMQWYKKAANFSDDAKFRLGVLYENGYGVTQDYSQAMQWYRQINGNGTSAGDALLHVGLLYENGYGVKKDRREATNLYLTAMLVYKKDVDNKTVSKMLDIDKRIPDAMYNIGLMYYKGQGIPKDKKTAIIWYQKAAALGNPDAIDALKKLGQ